jgi:nucleoside-diphosphate-sugar epimerase
MPPELGDTYALSKVAGEGLVLAASTHNRVVRLSNVYGRSFRSNLFLSDILRQAVQTGSISLRSCLDSSKDYISVDDVSELILTIAGDSEERIYNIAAGYNTTHRQLIDEIVRLRGVRIEVPDDAPKNVVPLIDVRLIKDEFGFGPRDVVSDLADLVSAFASELEGIKR